MSISITSGMMSSATPLKVKTLQVYKLWENPQGTKSTRATIALINGYSKVTLGKYFLIKDADEAAKYNLPANKWLPEKKGKHLCLGIHEIKALGQHLQQITTSLDEAPCLDNDDVQRAGVSGHRSFSKGALRPANTFSTAARNATTTTTPGAAATTSKKRAAKSAEYSTQAHEDQTENGYVREEDDDDDEKDSRCEIFKQRRYAKRDE